MERVRSPDGTRIAHRARGRGEPVLFVHGSIASSGDWAYVGRLLRDRFRVVTMDRRGRGASDWGSEPYSIAQEAEDIAAVLEATGARKVVAHSYGGLCAITALGQGAPIERLMLYEPPVSVPPEAFVQHTGLADALRAGRREDATERFLRTVGATEQQVELIRRSPAWPELLDAVPTLPRELATCRDWTMPAGPFDIPALLLIGGDTTSRSYLDGIPGIETVFPELGRDVLAGQTHVGHVFAAEAFAAIAARFLAVTI